MRYWSLLFLLVALVCTGVFLYAPLDPDWWLLRNPSTLGREVDHLFLIILYITGAVCVWVALRKSLSKSKPGVRPARFSRTFARMPCRIATRSHDTMIA